MSHSEGNPIIPGEKRRGITVTVRAEEDPVLCAALMQLRQPGYDRRVGAKPYGEFNASSFILV